MYNPYTPLGPDNYPQTDSLYRLPPSDGAPTSSGPSHPDGTAGGHSHWAAAPAPKPAKKKRRGAVAGIAAACLTLSVAAGFGGGYLAGQFQKSPSAGTASGGQSVMYQSVANSGNTGELSVAEVAAKAADSVVEVTAQSTGSFFGQTTTSAGSGVILTADGYIVTNNHVVEGGDTFAVRTRDGTSYDARLIGTDSQTDLAVLKIEASGLTPAVLGDSDALVVGETAVAIGNPLGELGGSVTSGIISALSREITTSDGVTMHLLQTSAAINPGNSGGGLFNSDGELIGIVNAKSVGTEIEGIGFAIPINTAKSVIEDLINQGYVSGRVDTGFTVVDLTDAATAYQYGVRQTGIYVLRVTSNTDGFRSGDLLYTIGGTEIQSLADYNNALSQYQVGDTVDVVVIRSGRTVSLTLTLQEAGKDTSESGGQTLI